MPLRLHCSCFARAGRKSKANCRQCGQHEFKRGGGSCKQSLGHDRTVGLAGTTACIYTFGTWCLTRGSKAGWEQPGVPRFKFCRAAAAKYETVPGPTGLEALSGTAGTPHGFGSACRTWNHAQPDRADSPSVALSRQKEQCQLQAFTCSGRGHWTTYLDVDVMFML